MRPEMQDSLCNQSLHNNGLILTFCGQFYTNFLKKIWCAYQTLSLLQKTLKKY